MLPAVCSLSLAPSKEFSSLPSKPYCFRAIWSPGRVTSLQSWPGTVTPVKNLLCSTRGWNYLCFKCSCLVPEQGSRAGWSAWSRMKSLSLILLSRDQPEGCPPGTSRKPCISFISGASYQRNSLKTLVAGSGVGYCETDALWIPDNFVLPLVLLEMNRNSSAVRGQRWSYSNFLRCSHLHICLCSQRADVRCWRGIHLPCPVILILADA